MIMMDRLSNNEKKLKPIERDFGGGLHTSNNEKKLKLFVTPKPSCSSICNNEKKLKQVSNEIKSWIKVTTKRN